MKNKICFKNYCYWILFFGIISINSCNNEDSKSNSKTDPPSKIKEQKKTYPDSSEYWINVGYLNCLKSESSVCDCLSEHEFNLLFIDSAKTEMIIQSSILHFGLETRAKYELNSVSNSKSNFIINKEWPLEDKIKIKIIDYNTLILNYKNKEVRFKRENLRTLDIPKSPKGLFSQEMDISDQLGVINSQSLLKYCDENKKSNTYPLISPAELRRLIENHQVSVFCSDDFHDNSMRINGDTIKHYHLEYGKDKISIFDEKGGRNRGEKIDIRKMKKQDLFLKNGCDNF